MKRLAASLFSRFRTSERGAVLVETLIVFNVILLFVVAMLEFGVTFWERQQLQAGVRDAARYWSRCNALAATGTTPSCSIATATAIATTGRVAATLTITPSSPPTNYSSSDIVTVTGVRTHSVSPLFTLLDIAPPRMTYTYKTRYLGW